MTDTISDQLQTLARKLSNIGACNEKISMCQEISKKLYKLSLELGEKEYGSDVHCRHREVFRAWRYMGYRLKANNCPWWVYDNPLIHETITVSSSVLEINIGGRLHTVKSGSWLVHNKNEDIVIIDHKEFINTYEIIDE